MKNQSGDCTAPKLDDELNPGINFIALHKTFVFNTSYEIKEEPIDHDL